MDSAVAALRLIDEGRTLETATVRLWPGDDRRSCCSPGALQRAAQTAEWLGLPLHFVDREAEFAAEVVEPFVAAYLAGETPNPCVSCNPGRLAALVGLADELGLARVATGHYARLVWRDGEPFVARAADRAKDQSYMLWAVPPEVLARLEFPLGRVDQGRDARGRGGRRTAVAGRAREPGGLLRRRRLPAVPRGARRRSRGPGRSSTATGACSARTRATGGTRSASGAASACRRREPLYVLARRAAENEVVVGRRDELETRGRGARTSSTAGWATGTACSCSCATARRPCPSSRALERSRPRRASCVSRLGLRPSAASSPGQSSSAASVVTTWWSVAACVVGRAPDGARPPRVSARASSRGRDRREV